MDDRKVRLTAFLISYAVGAGVVLTIIIRFGHGSLGDALLLVGTAVIGAGLIITWVLRGWTHRPKLRLAWLIVAFIAVPLGSTIFLQFNPPKSVRVVCSLVVAVFLIWLLVVPRTGKRGK
jgi:hypothetical protein